MIKLQNVSIGYNSIVLRGGLNYNFDKDKIYGILGKSGVGKTTLLKTIAGLLPSIDGVMEIDDEIRDSIYMMHQSYTCFDWLNCIDNILITERIKHNKITKELREKAISILADVGLSGYENHYPTQLSGGQRQRLALARTLFTSPKVILMDEPLSALDEETRIGMQDLILDIHNKTHNTIIIVTHSEAEANKMCDEIINF